MALPKINETGRLTADPELRFTPAGRAVANVTIAFNKSRKNNNDEWEQVAALFVRGAVWGEAGELVAESLRKGDEVMVSGELSMREYERKDGEKGQSLEVAIWTIGPAIRRHSVAIQRAERSKDKPAEDPWSTAAPAGNGGFSDEPPF